MKDFYNAAVRFFSTAGWRIVAFLAVLTAGIIAVRLLGGFFRRALQKSPLESTVCGFIMAVIRFVMWLLLLFMLAAVANIPTTPLVTALGAVGLALSLAVKDSLSNLANGIVLMGTKPFKVDDFVDIDGVSGTVKAIKMMNCELITPDNKKVLVPNGKITSAHITNYSAKPSRRVDIAVGVEYGSDINKVRDCLLAVMADNPAVLAVPPPEVRLTEFGESALLLSARAWVQSGDYWAVKFALNENIAEVFAREGINIPFNKLDVHLKK